MSETRRPLGCLGSEINVSGEEVLRRRVGPERTAIDRHTRAMYERREEAWRPLHDNAWRHSFDCFYSVLWSRRMGYPFKQGRTAG